MYAVIMAGGAGKRFWPRSRRKCPKQFLNIVEEDKSMLRLTYDRLKRVTSIDKIFIVAGEPLYEKTLEALPEFPDENYIMEPSGKNTAPCIGLSALFIREKDPEAVMGVFPADHYIRDVGGFVEAVKLGVEVARQENGLVTFGISPTRPATGYGYIQIDKKSKLYEGKVYRVKTFAEKPNYETALKFLESGEFLWNSGMFIWKASTILTAIKNCMPELYDSLMKIQEVINRPEYEKVLKEEWQGIHPESIDYGVMEKARNVYVIKGDFNWSDVGSWDSVYDLKEKDSEGNIRLGKSVCVDTKGCYIFSEKLLIATAGVEDLVIIQSGDSILVTKRGESEKVKQIVEQLEKAGKVKYL